MSTLVVGATGFVGQQIALTLQRETGQVRGLVRGGAANPKASTLSTAAIQIVAGDLTQPDTLADACSGVETVICTATTMPTGADDGLRRVDRDGTLALIDAAEAAGVRKFVYTSYTGNVTVDCPLHTAKRDCEARLLRSGMEIVVLRPSYFMEMWLSPLLGFDPLGGAARIYGRGEGKVSYISALDVASIGVAAALRSTGKQAILEMGGPEPLSQLDAVRIFEATLGTTCRLEFVPLEALQQQHLSTDPLQKSFAALMLGYAQGDVIPGAAALAQAYGIALRSVSDYAGSLRAQRTGV
jgi:NADH dehydrogenase